MFELTVSVPIEPFTKNGALSLIDASIALERLAGTDCGASGFCFLDNNRDMAFWYETLEECEEAQGRIAAAYPEATFETVVL